jgi:nucleoside-diphosphate-sugar epimerase
MTQSPDGSALRILVTGARGKVGSRVVALAKAAGHEVTATDLGTPVYGAPTPGEAPYVRADLTDYGQTIAVVTRARPDVVVHTAGIPDPAHEAAHVIFANNTTSMFNVAEAVARAGVGRLIYTSSETVPGFVTAERAWVPEYVPVDEEHPIRPQDAYAVSKYVGEVICDALVRRSNASVVSVRPSFVATERDYAGFLGVLRSGPARPFPNIWSYVDADDLAALILLATTAATVGHEIVYAAQPDNFLGRPLAELLAEAYGADAPPLRRTSRPDAGGIEIAKARRLFGWDPRRSWRDHV